MAKCTIKDGKYFAPNGEESLLYKNLRENMSEDEANDLFVLSKTPSFQENVVTPLIEEYRNKVSEIPANIKFKETFANKIRTFHIYDGKYYLIKFKDRTVEHAPGVGDITKQYLYEQAYKSLAEKNNYTFTNQFIIPKDNLLEDKGEGVLFAEVSLPLFDSFNLSSIKVTARNCELIFKEYLLS